MEVLPTILMEAAATHTGVLRVFMDTMVGMDTLARGQLRLSPGMDMVMDMELLLSMSPRLTMDMDTTLPITLMDIILDMDMARGTLRRDVRDAPIFITRVSGIITALARGLQNLGVREDPIILEQESDT